jgi:hypothetical protein
MTAASGGNCMVTLPEIARRQSGLTGAVMLCGDFTKSIIGIRRDISFKMFTEGVISNDSGAVILNLMQQDSVAMRMTMRLAYATVNPVTIMQPSAVISGGGTQRWPFGAILPVGATPPTASPLSVQQAPPYPYTGSFMVEGMSAEPDVENAQELEAEQAQRAYAEQVEGEAREGLKTAAARRQSRAPSRTQGRSSKE